jgi:hypothetical protein
MEDNLSFMNWGFAPSKNASGWIFHWSSNYWHNQMRARDVYNYPGLSYSLEKPFKELLIEFISDRLNYYLYEMDNIEYMVLNELEFNVQDYSLKILGKSVRFPTNLQYWFPILIAEDLEIEDYERIREIIEPITEDDDWLQKGIRKFIDQTVGEITNSEIVNLVESKELPSQLAEYQLLGYDDVSINAIDLQKIKS